MNVEGGFGQEMGMKAVEFNWKEIPELNEYLASKKNGNIIEEAAPDLEGMQNHHHAMEILTGAIKE